MKRALFFAICVSVIISTSTLFATSFYSGYRTGYDLVIDKYDWDESTDTFSLAQSNITTITTPVPYSDRGSVMAFGANNTAYFGYNTSYDIIISKYNFNEQTNDFSIIQANVATITIPAPYASTGIVMDFNQDGSILYMGYNSGSNVIINKYNWNESDSDFSLISNVTTITLPASYSNNGRAIAFGPDNTLYLGYRVGYDMIINKYNFDEENDNFSLITSAIDTLSTPAPYSNAGAVMDFEYTPIPEPTSLVLLLSCCGAFFLKRKRR